MLSEESVQSEGVKSLIQVCKDGIIEKNDADFLMKNVLQILFKKQKEVDNAKVGSLLLLEAFVKEDIFSKQICVEFMQE